MCELWFQEEKPQMSRGMTVGKSREGSGQGSWDLRQDPLLTDCLSVSFCSLSAEELEAFQKERAVFLAAQKEADLAAQAEAAKK